ncbi:ribonuclease inhibitor-like [Colossoma macropomum]|uniref:ribonuclease inhibitor-like n=1 Tax=Colossoma macropomum TaxID=42526 RepID=UPI001864A6F7|nr:ribonuclease inhibitor-like [Colossoma macropomum]
MKSEVGDPQMGIKRRPNDELDDLTQVTSALLNCLSDNTLKKILKDILVSLQSVVLNGSGLTEKSCAVLASALSSENSALTELDLSNNYLKDSGVKKLCEGLKSENCKLLKLKLFGCSLKEEDCVELASVLSSENSTLRELDLSQNELKNPGMKKLCEGLKSPNCKLEILRLEEVYFRVEGCIYIVEALKSNPSSQLKELNLNHNEQRDIAVKELSELLKDPRCKLENLQLRYCDITDKGCAALASALKSNPSSQLRELNLKNNQPGESDKKELYDLLKDPRCKLKKLERGRLGQTRRGWSSRAVVPLLAGLMLRLRAGTRLPLVIGRKEASRLAVDGGALGGPFDGRLFTDQCVALVRCWSSVASGPNRSHSAGEV